MSNVPEPSRARFSVSQVVQAIVTVTPNPSVDRTYEIPALAAGEINRAARVHQEPSGKGVNVTRALTVNGVPSLAVLPVRRSRG